ncbi:hypothetical protein ACFYO5_09300 [Streptomyces sp. NPDC006259]|uniref:hypothetical protein n=1 Tax=Streptomyces sp. NPDC006259 TaxID=3364740 RepID=UPI0036C6E02B
MVPHTVDGRTRLVARDRRRLAVVLGRAETQGRPPPRPGAGAVLDRATRSEVPEALDRYVDRRIGRTTRVQAGSARADEEYHLPDGPEDLARNARLVSYAAENRSGPHAPLWAADILAGDTP